MNATCELRRAVLLLLLALAACSKSRRAPPATVAPSADTPIEIFERHLKILELGTEPRSALRIHATPGATTLYRLEQDSHASRQIAGSQEEQRDPHSRLDFRQVVLGAAADGSFRVELTVTALTTAGAPPGTDDLLKSLVGLRLTLEMSARGTAQRGTVHAPPGLTPAGLALVPELATSLQGLYPDLPEEAIGPGARWTVENSLRSGGVSRDFHFDCRLDGGTAAAVDMRCAETLSAEPQEMTMASMQPGDRARLLRLSGSGDQTAHLTFAGPVVTGAGTFAESRTLDYSRGSLTQHATETRQDTFRLAPP